MKGQKSKTHTVRAQRWGLFVLRPKLPQKSSYLIRFYVSNNFKHITLKGACDQLCVSTLMRVCCPEACNLG